MHERSILRLGQTEKRRAWICEVLACGKAGKMRLAGNAEKGRIFDRKTAFLRQKVAFLG